MCGLDRSLVNVHSRHILQDLSMGLGLNPVHDIFYVINIEWKDVLRTLHFIDIYGMNFRVYMFET